MGGEVLKKVGRWLIWLKDGLVGKESVPQDTFLQAKVSKNSRGLEP